MTVNECLEMVESLSPAAVETEIRLRWLSELEGTIRVELLGEAVQAQTLLTADDGDVQLIASHPYDQMYWMYLLAMLFCASGEVARYENAAALFNAAYMGYAKLIKRGEA